MCRAAFGHGEGLTFWFLKYCSLIRFVIDCDPYLLSLQYIIKLNLIMLININQIERNTGYPVEA